MPEPALPRRLHDDGLTLALRTGSPERFAVTAADGLFRFDNVPPGQYTLVVWHERFGTKQQRVRVQAHIETRVELAY